MDIACCILAGFLAGGLGAGLVGPRDPTPQALVGRLALGSGCGVIDGGGVGYVVMLVGGSATAAWIAGGAAGLLSGVVIGAALRSRSS